MTVSSPDPERVRSAIAKWPRMGARWKSPGLTAVVDGDEMDALLDAAKAWLAGSSPDYEAAARQLIALADKGHSIGTLSLHDVRSIVDAAFPNREGGSPQ